MQRSTQGAEALLWERFQYMGIGLLPAGVTMFAQNFLSERTRILGTKAFRWPVYILSVFFSISAFSELYLGSTIVTDRYYILDESYSRYGGTVGPLFYFTMVFLVCALGLVIIAFITSYLEETSPRRKKGIRLVLLGVLFTVGIATLTDVILPLVYIFFPMADLMTVLFVGASAFAITKYKILLIGPIHSNGDGPGPKRTLREIPKGTFVIVKVTKENEHITYFQGLVKKGFTGFVVTGEDPDRIKGMLKGMEVPIIWISEMDLKRVHFNPTQLSEIKESFLNIFEGAQRFAVLIDTPNRFFEKMTSSYDMVWGFIDVFKSVSEFMRERSGKMIISVENAVKYSEEGSIIYHNDTDDLWWDMPKLLLALQVHGLCDPVTKDMEKNDRASFIKTFHSFTKGQYEISDKDGHCIVLGKPAGTRDDLIKVLKALMLSIRGLKDAKVHNTILNNVKKLGIEEAEWKYHQGGSYIILGKDRREVFKDLKALCKRRPSMCISKQPSKKILMEHGPDIDCEFFWITGVVSGSKAKDLESSIVKLDLTYIYQKMNQFVEKNPSGVMLLDGVEFLISQFGFDPTLRFVEKIVDVVAMSNVVLFVPMDPSSMKEMDLAILERLMDKVDPF